MLGYLRQIAIFAKTAEQGSFRKAADALRLSPSVVSHHIATLEQQLDVALFYRSTRKLSLTSDGERLLASAQMIVNGAEEFIGAASRQSSQLTGQLKVTLPAVLAKSALVDRIGDFCKENPSLNLLLDFSDNERDIVHEGIDLAIRMGWPQDSSLKARKLARMDRLLVASASYLETRPQPSSPLDLDDWNWIELSPVGLKQVFIHREEGQITIKAQSQIAVNSAHALLQLAKNGNGVTVLPRFLAGKLIDNGHIQEVLGHWRPKPIDIYAVWPGNTPRWGLTKRLVGFLVQNQATLFEASD